MQRLLIATGNRGKLREFSALLPGIEIDGLDAYPGLVLEEPHATYHQNAAAKALQASRATGRVALADDSGLEVDSLDGAPGVHSARYAGEHGDDAANRRKLLAALEGIPAPARTARFRCVLALADVAGGLEQSVLYAEGVCEGFVVDAPRGSLGFGYDPLIRPAHASRTFAELTDEEKHRVSHRGRAARAFLPTLAAYLRSR